MAYIVLCDLDITPFGGRRGKKLFIEYVAMSSEAADCEFLLQ